MSLAAAWRPSRAQLQRNADWLAVAVAVALPWSTTAFYILGVGLLIALIPTLDLAALRRVVMTPAGGVPVLLVVLAAFGMLWSEVSWTEAFDGLGKFAKLLIIPLMLVQFRRSDRGMPVLAGFLVSCIVLLALSLTLAVWPRLWGFVGKGYGVPVKDYIAQSGEFVICTFATAFLALDLYRTGRCMAAIACLMLAATFLFDVLYIATGRTALVTIPFLLVLLALRQFGWKGAAGILAAGIVLGAIVWTSSPYLRGRVTALAQEVEAYQVNRDATSATSAGLRLDFWKNSLRIMTEAPLIGHGTGSIRSTFEKAMAGESGPWAKAVMNPHNQILAVGIQLGLVGIAVLFAMWLSHFLLFRGPGLISWIGLIIVVQNIISSLFNSHLFDFVQGWTYVFGVGVAGGMILRGRAEAQQSRKQHAASLEGLHAASGSAPVQRPL